MQVSTDLCRVLTTQFQCCLNLTEGKVRGNREKMIYIIPPPPPGCQSFEHQDSLQPFLTDKWPNNSASFFPPAKKAMKLKSFTKPFIKCQMFNSTKEALNRLWFASEKMDNVTTRKNIILVSFVLFIYGDIWLHFLKILYYFVPSFTFCNLYPWKSEKPN